MILISGNNGTTFIDESDNILLYLCKKYKIGLKTIHLSIEVKLQYKFC